MAVHKNQECENVVIVGEDVDLLVLLIHFGSGVENDIYFLNLKWSVLKTNISQKEVLCTLH